MTRPNNGSALVVGAAVQSWNKDSPRPMLEKMIDQYSGDPADIDSRREVFEEFNRTIRQPAHEAKLLSIIEYWFTNNYQAFLRSKFQQQARDAERNAALERRRKKLKNSVRILLSDMIMPNGNPLRDCTGEECIRAGGWLTHVGEKVGPNGIVGHVLKERQLQHLFKRVQETRRSKKKAA